MKNKIKRDFDGDDLLIQKINMFLLNPEKIKNIYPELIQYLPDEYKYYPSDDEDNNCFEEYEHKDESDKDEFNKIMNENIKEVVPKQNKEGEDDEGEDDEGVEGVDEGVEGVDEGVELLWRVAARYRTLSQQLFFHGWRAQ